MVWFKKRDGKKTDISNSLKVPEPGKSEEINLPKLPEEGISLPKLPEEGISLPKLPALPKIDYSEDEEAKNTEENGDDLDKEAYSGMKPSMMNNLLKEQRIKSPLKLAETIREEEPIFIKIERFKEAAEKFSEIKEKVLEIEEMFKEMQGIRLKEEKELKEWEREIRLIKTRIEDINNTLFKKIK